MFLSPYACKSIDTVGRLKEEPPCPMRTPFQRDRDRIIYCKAFRRLKNKTQVFFSPEGDHYRTRLTHTLSVAQIARSVARALSLNEDLTEAVALGHDLGHTPFGHSGERILNKLNPRGFSHNRQSVRVVDHLENDGKGLNLTREVVDGILNHKMGCKPKTLEGMAVNYADRIAYINHDIDDAIAGGFITADDLPKDAVELLGKTSGERINSLILAIFRESDGKDFVKMAEEEEKAMATLRAFMFERVYDDVTFKTQEKKAERMIGALYDYFSQHTEVLPEFYVKELITTDKDTVLCDYISGMSDGYAVKTFSELFIPDKWEF
ncbi:MAG: deoxyguanosinetriphosphate triphosphohydrolase [Clostridia bacterium]|nr:deoxyguanosinetriphosphate triphosphohydrolase [Clostridia bacterium]